MTIFYLWIAITQKKVASIDHGTYELCSFPVLASASFSIRMFSGRAKDERESSVPQSLRDMPGAGWGTVQQVPAGRY